MSETPRATTELDELAAVRARMIALSAELASARRELHVQRALRAHPSLSAAAVELITATDEASFLAQADALAAYLSRP